MRKEQDMARVTFTTTVDAPIETTFQYVDDYTNATKYMKDLVVWKPTGKVVHGIGAEFAVGMKAGPKVLESTIHFTEWKENHAMAWESVSGLQQTGRWAFRKRGEKTEATFTMEYELGGGIAGKVLAKAVEPVIQMNIESSVKELKKQVEAWNSGAHAKGVPVRKRTPAATK